LDDFISVYYDLGSTIVDLYNHVSNKSVRKKISSYL